ncbi:hypothetical protein Vadar_010975 [Vaccinium darrowii]|uniref:Uncharacterized protein n=1 Tax=Vaccinium darrowii TaxID=229202 RepID=A0ACB7XQ45_9ERIC|nr:hypothetical protein Vadar_010975 [Vaccinium darrowii]
MHAKMATHNALGAIIANIPLIKATKVARIAMLSKIAQGLFNTTCRSCSTRIVLQSKGTTAKEQHIAKASDKMNAQSAGFFTRFASPLLSYPPGIANAAVKVTVAMSAATTDMVLIMGFRSSSGERMTAFSLSPPIGTMCLFGRLPRGAPSLLR